MATDQTQIANLIVKYLIGLITPHEQQELDTWLQASPDNLAHLKELEDSPGIAAKMADYRVIKSLVQQKWETLEHKYLRPVPASATAPAAPPPAAPPPTSVYRRLRPLLSVAAIVLALLLILFTVRFFTGTAVIRQQEIGAVQPGLRNDVSPGASKALLTLGDGSTIVLDSAHTGALASQGGVQVIKLANGRLAYRPSGKATGAIIYNTVSTPAGGQYQVSLPDGTQVWLNAGSSLRYPASFSDTARVVELKGEAYFEVAKNTAAPFKVKTPDNTETRVLGTHFSIMAYPDEQAVKANLLEGAVQVRRDNQTVNIKPGEQARIAKGEIMVGKVNVNRETAWVKGYFDFYDDNLATVMRQASRWYDVDVVFQSPMDDLITFKIRRDVPLSKLLGLLEQTGRVRFAVDGRRLTIIPVK